MDPRITKLANVLVDYSLNIKKGDLFKIQGHHLSIPLINEVFKLALAKGANPYIDILLPEIEEIFYKQADDDQLSYISKMRKLEVEEVTSLLSIRSADNTRYLSNVDPARQALTQKSRKDLFHRFFERSANRELLWCATLFPCQAMAQDAEMSLTDFEDFVYSAGHCDEDDPVAYWEQFSLEQEKLCDKMNKLSTIHIKSAGTDLKLNVQGRKWINCAGKYNFPDGEVFTGPIEDSANGHITYSYPACYGGREVENVQLTFKDGLVTKFSADKNENFLKEMLNMDDGAKRLGELAIGTNYNVQNFTKNILFDEKIGGTCHLAVGNSIIESGGLNKSSLHWDMVCELRNGGEIYGDDQLIYKDGKFLTDFHS